MTDGSLPTTYLRFIPLDMHLDQNAYLQKKIHYVLACCGREIDIQHRD